jgi:hypothetical protein
MRETLSGGTRKLEVRAHETCLQVTSHCWAVYKHVCEARNSRHTTRSIKSKSTWKSTFVGFKARQDIRFRSLSWMFSRTQVSQKHGMVARYLRIAPTVCARLFHPHCREQQRQATWWSQHLRRVRPRGEDSKPCAGNGGNPQLRPSCRFGPLKVFLA